MKRILVKSVYDAFDYVMAHYYPYGLKEMAEGKDRYAVISIQDTHTHGFGIEFIKSESCVDVLTLYFDDIERSVAGAVLFNDTMAEQIIDFISANKSIETLLIHCYGGQSRSKAVGAFAIHMLGGDNTKYLKNGTLNRYIYDTLENVWSHKTNIEPEE